MKRLMFMMLLAVAVVTLAGQEFPLRQSFDLRWEGFHQRTADNCELVFWTDTHAGHRDIYAQKLGPNGQALWSEPLAVVSHPGDQTLWAIVPSSDNNFILLWSEDYINDNLQLRAQKLSSNGQRLWPEDGVVIGGMDSYLKNATMAANNTGGAFVLFQYWFANEVRGQNLDAWGNQLWPLGGSVLASHSSNMELDGAVPDGEGGFIFNVSKYQASIWRNELYRYSPQGTAVGSVPLLPVGGVPNLPRYDIQPSADGSYVLSRFAFDSNPGLWQHRINNLGEFLTPTPVFTSLPVEGDPTLTPRLMPLEDGGTFICYHSSAASWGTLLAQRFTADFSPVWTQNGIEFAGAADSRIDLRLAPTGEGGAWISWLQQQVEQEAVVVRGQYISPAGALPWGLNGLALSLPADFNRRPVPVAWSDRGMFLWYDRLGGENKLLRQVVSTGGASFFAQNGLPLSGSLNGLSYQEDCFALGDRFCNLWQDTRYGFQLFYQLSDSSGQTLLDWGGVPLNPPFIWAEYLIDARKTPWNTVAIVYKRVDYDAGPQLSYLQEIDASGTKLHPGPGVYLGENIPWEYQNHLGCKDGSIYLGWIAASAPNQAVLRGQRVQSGQTMWEAEGRVLETFPLSNNYVSFNRVVGDYYLWREENYSLNLIQCKTLRVDANGDPAPGWNAGGISIIPPTPSNNQELRQAGLWGEDLVAFIRLYESGNYPTRAQRVSPSGGHLWQDGGVDLTPPENWRWIQDVVFDTELGYIYITQGTDTNQLWFQKLDANGQQLLPGASLIAEGLHNCYDAQLEKLADGTWFCAWSDHDGAWIENRNVFARHLTPQGTPLGNAPLVFCGERFQQDWVRTARIGNTVLTTWQDDRAGILNSETAITGIWGRLFTSHYVSVDDPQAPAPVLPVLHANYPNPFNPSTTISFSLPEAAHASLEIYNLKGQLVRRLLDGAFLLAGGHLSVWDGTDAQGRSVGSGIYLSRLRVGDQILTRRMVLAK